MNWFCDSSFDGPTSIKAFKYCGVEHTKLPCPDRQRLSLATMGQEMVISLIDRLLVSCHPVTVFRAIRAVVVASFNRKSGLIRWPHVCHKVPQFVPSFADSDVASAIVFVILILLISASLVHTLPYIVKGRARPVIFFMSCAPCFRMIIGFLAIFALVGEAIFLGSIGIKIRNWFRDLAVTTSFKYDRFRHGSFSFAKRLCLEPGEVRPSFGSLIIEPQFCGVKP